MAHLSKNQSQDDLTRPGLYSIYDNSINDNDSSIYEDLSSNIAKHPPQDTTTSPTPRVHLTTRVLQLITSCIILSALGIMYTQVGQHIHDNHILVPELASKPLRIGFDITHNLIANAIGLDIPRSAVYAIEGIFLGSIVPLVDRFVFRSKPSKLIGIDNSSIVRAGVAFLGVAFAVRKIEWASSLQAALAWTMLNPCLWLLLDGTLSGFSTGFLMATIASVSVVVTDIGLPQDWSTNGEFIATMLWLGNFIFFGLIVFGNIGRYLFV